MKKYYLLLFLLLGLSLHPNKSYANRGDIVSYELMDDLTSDDVVNYGMSVVGNFLPVDSEVSQILQLYFKSIIDERNLTVYKVIYETVNFDDNPVQASGVVIIPSHPNFICEKSFSLYGHGTRFDREGVFSRRNAWDSEFFLALLMSSINTICVAPDYYGMGDGDGFHHHNSYKTNATSSLDLVRAGRHLCDILGVPYNNKFLPMGYSEGGTNSMGVAKMIHTEGLQDEFNISLLGCGSGAYDLSGEAYNFITNNPFYPTRQYILYLLATCENMYGNLIDEEAGESISTYLKSPYDQLYIDNLLTQNGNVGWAPQQWATMFYPEAIQQVLSNPNHPFRVCLKNSDVYFWRNPYKTFLYYCTTDEQVPYTGALKTRDIQRAFIPWYQFWNRFKIQAIDLTLDVIPDHSTCALPSIFVELFFMQFNLGLSCEPSGREANQLKLTSITGEMVANEVIYSDKFFNLKQLKEENDLKSIELLNLINSQRISSNDADHITLQDGGMYLVLMTRNNGEQVFNWLFKMAPDYVNTADYDPILNNPMNQSTKLDLSLLEEEIQQIAIVDRQGTEYLVINDNLDQKEFLLERTKAMKDGEYTVEVRTAEFTYPLLLKVDSKANDKAISVYPNPSNETVNINLGFIPTQNLTIRIFDVQGALVSQTQGNTQIIQLNVGDLGRGFYVVEIADNKQKINTNFVKQ
jgi:hypothetical protein